MSSALHQKLGSDVETNDVTHVPRENKRFIAHIQRLSGERQGKHPSWSESGWSEERVCVLCHFSCVQLCETTWTAARQVPSVHGILQVRILGWVAMPSSGDLSHPGMEPVSLMSPTLAGRFFTTSATWEALEMT